MPNYVGLIKVKHYIVILFLQTCNIEICKTDYTRNIDDVDDG